MSNIKNDFKDWLSTQKLSEKSVSAYLRAIQTISNRYFSKGTKNDWQALSKKIVPLLTTYYELSNREYYLDRITIWPTLHYFKRISNSIFKSKNINQDPMATISVFDGQQDHFICKTPLRFLYDDIQMINQYLYDRKKGIKGKDNSTVDIFKLLSLIAKLESTEGLSAPKDMELHIIYETKGLKQEKAALTQYFNMMMSTKPNDKLLQQNQNNKAHTEKHNPNVEEPMYITDREITGSHPRQIKVTQEAIDRDNVTADNVLKLKDLKEIFKIDTKTVHKLLTRFNFNSDSTNKRTYYSIESTNCCLDEFFNKPTKKQPNVKYDLEGYDFWITRADALDILKFGRCSIYTYLRKKNPKYEDDTNANKDTVHKVTYIDYAQNAPLYYKPEVDAIALTKPVQELQNRKKYVKKK